MSIFTLERYLTTIRNGQWFDFSDHNDRSYKNLIIVSDDPKPTEEECNKGVADMQAEYDANKYQRDRAVSYPSWQEQMDLIYHSGVAGLKAELKKTKDKYPKG
jgi:hypothetical protein